MEKGRAHWRSPPPPLPRDLTVSDPALMMIPPRPLVCLP